MKVEFVMQQMIPIFSTANYRAVYFFFFFVKDALVLSLRLDQPVSYPLQWDAGIQFLYIVRSWWDCQ